LLKNPAFAKRQTISGQAKMLKRNNDYLIFEKSYLTRHLNDFFRRIPLFSRSLMWQKTEKTESFDAGFPCSGDRTILHFGADGPLGEGFTKKSTDRYAIFLFSFLFVDESKQDYPTLRCGWTLGEGFS
jgi:hypothetical protein